MHGHRTETGRTVEEQEEEEEEDKEENPGRGSGVALCNQGQLKKNTIILGEGRSSRSSREEAG